MIRSRFSMHIWIVFLKKCLTNIWYIKFCIPSLSKLKYYYWKLYCWAEEGVLLSDNSVKICQKDNKSFVCSCWTARAYGQFMVTMLSLFSSIILTKKRGFLFLAYNKLGLPDLRRDEFGESQVFQFWYLHFWEGNFYHFPLKCRKKELRI